MRVTESNPVEALMGPELQFIEYRDCDTPLAAFRGTINDRQKVVGVHDERRRPLRTGEHLRPLEYQNDRTLCEAGEATHRSNQRHSAGNLEDP
jgi:hypothetical protein